MSSDCAAIVIEKAAGQALRSGYAWQYEVAEALLSAWMTMLNIVEYIALGSGQTEEVSDEFKQAERHGLSIIYPAHAATPRVGRDHAPACHGWQRMDVE